MSLANNLVHEAEAVGLSFRVKGEQVIVRFPMRRRTELAPLIDKLKQHKEEVEELVRSRPVRLTETDWPPASLDAERRFAEPHARLFPFIGCKVRTPAGPGTMLQVFAERVTVLLDSEITKCSSFPPGQIEPVNGEWPK
jgi:hypothetical protein